MKKLFLVLALISAMCVCYGQDDVLKLNEQEYLEMTGLNVMLAHDFYPESHQGGVGIIQNGLRVGTNGDLRLEPTPGQGSNQTHTGTRCISGTFRFQTCQSQR